MVNLPPSSKLTIAPLASVFNDVTNSYKFYWFLAILQAIRLDPRSRLIPISELLAHMIAAVWYPRHYFLLSFGKQDRLGEIVDALKNEDNSLSGAATPDEIVASVLDILITGSALAQQIETLADYVPQRFLRVFFSNNLRGVEDWKVDRAVKTLAARYFEDENSPCFYRFVSEPYQGIEIQPIWYGYLQEHLHILESFCLWHLANYLQKHNPNVPNILGKLFRPEHRELKQARTFWKLVFAEVGQVECIYSGQFMVADSFSLDHFLPWRFVAHDLLWNIIPTPKSVNSCKGDVLPDIDAYFDTFVRLQYDSVQVVVRLGRMKLLEDYLLLLNSASIEDLRSVRFEHFQQVLQDMIFPQIQIARNMGFRGGWRYSK